MSAAISRLGDAGGEVSSTGPGTHKRCSCRPTARSGAMFPLLLPVRSPLSPPRTARYPICHTSQPEHRMIPTDSHTGLGVDRDAADLGVGSVRGSGVDATTWLQAESKGSCRRGTTSNGLAWTARRGGERQAEIGRRRVGFTPSSELAGCRKSLPVSADIKEAEGEWRAPPRELQASLAVLRQTPASK
jgi:hypothetical protein